MSVAEQLGLDDPNDGLRVLARARWASWVERYPSLGVASGPEDLRVWLRCQDPDERDAVLGVLAHLGSARGGDDCAAAGLLLWVLLPGATAMAHRLRLLSPLIDELTAAQLWVEARTLPPTATGRVAATILRNTSTGGHFVKPSATHPTDVLGGPSRGSKDSDSPAAPARIGSRANPASTANTLTSTGPTNRRILFTRPSSCVDATTLAQPSSSHREHCNRFQQPPGCEGQRLRIRTDCRCGDCHVISP